MILLHDNALEGHQDLVLLRSVACDKVTAHKPNISVA